MTIQEELIKALRKAGHYNRNDLAAPRVVIWPDGERFWEKVVPGIAAAMPELMVLDASVMEGNRGPSTYLRYLIGRSEGKIPVLYLPGVARQAFKGAQGFPEEAKHLFALQFHGQFWGQLNGKDWTPTAFLTSADGGLDLEVGSDVATKEALSEQLQHLMGTATEQLQGQRITAELLHGLVADDPVRMLLQWMASDGRLEESWSKTTQWQGFQALAKKQFKLDPAKDGVITAAEQLVKGAKGWDSVWARYKESPRAYPGLKQVLERIQPDGIFPDNERMPANNSQQEDALREGLLSLKDLSQTDAQKQLSELVRTHALRAHWVWAQLGDAPMAQAVLYLGNMLIAMGRGFDTSEWSTAAKDYMSKGWKVDAAAREAYAVSHAVEVTSAVAVALRAIYLPWLEDVATRCQRLSSSYPKLNASDAIRYVPTAGSLLLFVDGLRADLCIELAALLESDGVTVQRETAWSALPTVTATAKPAWAPMTEQAHGKEINAGFNATLNSGKLLEAATFRSTLKQLGWSYLAKNETGDPATSAWTEAGTFDTDGHAQGAKLAWRVEEGLQEIKERVHELFAAGWTKIQVITDHGWLWMPGALPKVDMPKHLTISKWGRCAVPQAGADHGLPQVGWFWGAEHPIVLAPNVCVFMNGVEYAHGGLSIQEALTPVLDLAKGNTMKGLAVSVSSFKWVGMRLNVLVDGAFEGITLDLRVRPADAASTLLTKTKAPDENGKVSLAVANDEYEGTAAVLVLLKDDLVIAKQLVTIGEN